MKHKKHCKLCKDAPQPVELFPGWTIYPRCNQCGRKAVNVYDMTPEEFGRYLADHHADALRKVLHEVQR